MEFLGKLADGLIGGGEKQPDVQPVRKSWSDGQLGAVEVLRKQADKLYKMEDNVRKKVAPKAEVAERIQKRVEKSLKEFDPEEDVWDCALSRPREENAIGRLTDLTPRRYGLPAPGQKQAKRLLFTLVNADNSGALSKLFDNKETGKVMKAVMNEPIKRKAEKNEKTEVTAIHLACENDCHKAATVLSKNGASMSLAERVYAWQSRPLTKERFKMLDKTVAGTWNAQAVKSGLSKLFLIDTVASCVISDGLLLNGIYLIWDKSPLAWLTHGGMAYAAWKTNPLGRTLGKVLPNPVALLARMNCSRILSKIPELLRCKDPSETMIVAGVIRIFGAKIGQTGLGVLLNFGTGLAGRTIGIIGGSLGLVGSVASYLWLPIGAAVFSWAVNGTTNPLSDGTAKPAAKDAKAAADKVKVDAKPKAEKKEDAELSDSDDEDHRVEGKRNKDDRDLGLEDPEN